MGRSTIELLLAAALGAAITLALQAIVFDAAPEAELAPEGDFILPSIAELPDVLAGRLKPT